MSSELSRIVAPTYPVLGYYIYILYAFYRSLRYEVSVFLVVKTET